MKIGIHSGKCVGAVLGSLRSFYCVYGDTVSGCLARARSLSLRLYTAASLSLSLSAFVYACLSLSPSLCVGATLGCLRSFYCVYGDTVWLSYLYLSLYIYIYVEREREREREREQERERERASERAREREKREEKAEVEAEAGGEGREWGGEDIAERAQVLIAVRIRQHAEVEIEP